MNIINLFFAIVGIGYLTKSLRIYGYDKNVCGLIIAIIASVTIILMAISVKFIA